MAKRNQTKEQQRNLYQYRNYTTEEFDAMWEEKQRDIEESSDFENRVKKKIEEFSQDYDIDDLKINDRETLKAFIKALIALEDYEQFIYDVRTEGINQSNITVIDRVSSVISNTRKDISKLQEDLNISRRIRKMDKESSVVAYISNLKEQARLYMESKLSYIFCPKCDMLLANVWTLYPEENNVIKLTCHRTLDDGSLCGEVVKITTKELSERGGTNKKEILPESLL